MKVDAFLAKVMYLYLVIKGWNEMNYSQKESENIVKYMNSILDIYYPEQPKMRKLLKVKGLTFIFSDPDKFWVFENERGELCTLSFASDLNEDTMTKVLCNIAELDRNYLIRKLKFKYLINDSQYYVMLDKSVKGGIKEYPIHYEKCEDEFFRCIYLSDNEKRNILHKEKNKIAGKCSLMDLI